METNAPTESNLRISELLELNTPQKSSRSKVIVHESFELDSKPLLIVGLNHP